MKIPQYDQQVQTRAAPQVRQSAAGADLDAFGAARARAAEGVAKGLQNAGEFMQKRQDQEDADLLFRAQTTLVEEWNAKRAEIEQRQGQNAWGAARDAEAWFGEAQAKFGEGLVANPRAQRLFQQEVAKLRLQGIDFANRHELNQRDVSLKESANASITSSINLAVSDPGNTEVVAGAKKDILKRVEFLGQMEGWDPARKQLEVENKLTTLHSQVLKNLLDEGDGTAAADYYTANKGEIFGDARTQLKSMISRVRLGEQAQEAADVVMTLGEDEEASLAYIRQNYKGDAEEKIVTEVRARFAEQRRFEEEGRKKVTDGAYQYLMKNRRLPPETVLSRMGRDRASLEATYERMRTGAKVETNLAVYQMLSANPDKVRAMSDGEFYALSNVLSEGDFKKFAAVRGDKNGDKNNAGALDLGAVNTVLGVRLNGIGIDPNVKGDDPDGQRVAAIRMHVNDLVLEKQRLLGRKLDTKEISDLVDEQFRRNRKFRTSVLGIGTGEQSQRLFDMTLSDIPSGVRESLEADFAAQGIESPSEADMLGAYYQLDLMQRRTRR